ncbi:MAG TPA: peptidylprolyl isomerase [Anaerolineaceae bacterium]|nr:peptidylprolyl isomerase [Anaerolineaceae bacterium]
MAKKTESPKLVTRKHIARKEREEKQIKSALLVTGIVIGLALLLLAYVLIDSFIVQPNKVVARVGDAEIKAGDFESNVTYSRLNMLSTANNYAYYAQLFGDSGSQFKSAGIELVAQLNDTELIGENVLNQMIDDQLIREEAAKRGLTISDEEIQEAIQSSFGFYPMGTQTPTITPTMVNTPTWSSEQFDLIQPTETATPAPTSTATPDGWEPTLEPTATSEIEATPEASTPTVEPSATEIPTITPTPTVYTTKLYGKELGNYLDEVKNYGISPRQIEDIFRANLLRTKVSEDVTKELLPEEEQVWVRHILVDSEEKANEVIEKLNSGSEWAALAAEYSTDTSNKDNGGDLGWIGINDSYVEEFKDGAFALNETGQISEPVQSQFGWHVIQLVSKATNSIDAAKFQQNKQTFFDNWLLELRNARTDIQIEEIWKTITPSKPAVPAELTEFFFSQ